MKHFFGYTADGGLGSLHSYHGGWPANMNLADENSDVELVRKQLATHEDVEIGIF